MGTARIFNHHIHVAYLWLALFDALLFFGACWLGAILYFLLVPGSLENHIGNLPIRAATFALVTSLSMFSMGLYQPRLREGPAGILLRTLGAFVLMTLGMTVIFYFLPDLHLWRGIFVYSTTIAFTGSLLTRVVFSNVADMDALKRRVLILGTGEVADNIASKMRRKSDRRGFRITGFVCFEGEETHVRGETIINPGQPLSTYVRDQEIDQIVVALDDRREHLPLDELMKCRMMGVDILDIVSFFEREASKILIDYVYPSWFVFSDGFNRNEANSAAKRGFDIAASFFLMMGTWPIMLLTALAIKLEDGWNAPVLFHQTRVGLHGKPFSVMKFRSMSIDAEGDGKARWATRNDSRVTRVGRFIRKTRIDELPQIMNVMAGDMAFIGPRPERPEFVEDLASRIPYFRERHAVKPGITGWAQLNYPYGASEQDARNKLEYDLYYVKNQSLFLDFMVLLHTVEVILFGKGAR